jgi:hypothetical protein
LAGFLTLSVHSRSALELAARQARGQTRIGPTGLVAVVRTELRSTDK